MSDSRYNPESKEFIDYNQPLLDVSTWIEYAENASGNRPELEYYNAVASHVGAVERIIDSSDKKAHTFEEFKNEIRAFLNERKEFIKFAHQCKL